MKKEIKCFDSSINIIYEVKFIFSSVIDFVFYKSR